MWLLRSVLAIARAGMGDPATVSARGACISRSHMYMLQDVESKSGGRYASSGLIASADFLGAPKASYYHYAAMMAWVSDYVYQSDVSLGPSAPGAMACCFKKVNATTGQASFAIFAWMPTSNATILADAEVLVNQANCPIALPSGNVYVIVPTAPLLNGNVSTVVVSPSGGVNIVISEMPTIVISK